MQDDLDEAAQAEPGVDGGGMNLDGVQFPVRAIVRSSTAGSQYKCTVEVLDGAGQPTGQVLSDQPLDPLWLAGGGKGVWAPPDEGQIVAVVWAGGSAGHPVISNGALRKPVAPRWSVGAGEHSIQGDTWDTRHRAGEWILYDHTGAVLSAKSRRFKMAADDDLLTILNAWLDADIASKTVVDNDTDPGGSGAELAMNGATIAAYSAVKARLALVLRS